VKNNKISPFILTFKFITVVITALIWLTPAPCHAESKPAKKSSHTSHKETRTGFFLSLGNMYYTYNTYPSSEYSNVVGEPSDLFFGVTLNFKSIFEVSLVYNRSTEDFGPSPDLVTYDKDGFGLELGKPLPIHLFKKNSFDVWLEFVGGGYFIWYPFKKRNSGSGTPIYENPREDDSTYYQAGFYWAIRVKYMIAKKASINVGFKSMIPVRSNEFTAVKGREILLGKSFITVGISF